MCASIDSVAALLLCMLGRSCSGQVVITMNIHASQRDSLVEVVATR